jgi:hypothetical protein
LFGFILQKNVLCAFFERITIMEGQSLKRSIEDSGNIGSSENSKRGRVDNTVPRGFGSGPAGKHHLRFTGTAWEAYNQAEPSSIASDARASGLFPLNLNVESLYQEIKQQQDALVQQHEVYDQAGPSRQRDAQLNTEDSKILEHYTEYIFSDDPKKWSDIIGDVDIKYKEARRQQETGQTQVTSSQRPENQQWFAAHHPAKAQRVEQQQETLVQQREVHSQAGSSYQEEATKRRVKEGKIALIKDEMKRIQDNCKDLISDKNYDKIMEYYNQRLLELEKMDSNYLGQIEKTSKGKKIRPVYFC